MNHTSGPWKVFNNREIGPISKEDDQSYSMMLPVAYIEQYDYPNDYEANANLIAAAPDLLEALQELYHLIDSAHDGKRVFTTEMQKKVRAAIAKATGE